MLNNRKLFAASLLAVSLAGSGITYAQSDYSLEELQSGIQQGMDVNWAEPDGTTLLMNAIYNRESDKARYLIQQGADINATNRYGVTALYLAAQQGLADVAILLLAGGANTIVTTPEGETLLMTAAAAGSAEIVRALMADNPEMFMLGLDPNHTEAWKGQTALMYAAARGHTEVMEALIEGGADVDMQSAYVKPLTPDPDKRQGGFVYPDLPVGRLSALHFAAREGELGAVDVLIDAGADIDITDERGTTATVLATMNGHYEVAARLIEAGADPDIQDQYGRNVLFVGADQNTLDNTARPGPRLTTELRGHDIVRMVLEQGADPDLHLSARLPTLMSQGARANPMLSAGATPLFRAAMSGDLTVINMLLDAGADPHLGLSMPEEDRPAFFGPSRGGTTPFIVAAGLGWREGISRGREADAIATLDLLLTEYEADINVANMAGETALHGAAHRGSPEILEYLLENGADITALTNEGGSVLDIAEGNPDFTNRAEPKPEAVALLQAYLTPEHLDIIDSEKARIEAEKEAESEAQEVDLEE